MNIPKRTLISCGGLLLALLAMAADTEIVVKREMIAVRRNPQFFAPALLTLKAKDKLIQIGEANGWIQVKTLTGQIGWVHSSSVEIPKLDLRASNDPLKTRAETREAALAGKARPAPVGVPALKEQVPPESMSPQEIGRNIVEIVRGTWLQIGYALKDTPVSETTKTRIGNLKAAAVQKLIPLGKRRENMSAAEKAQIEEAIGKAIGLHDRVWDKAILDARTVHRGQDPALDRLLIECENLAEYVYFERLKERNPDEAKRLGIKRP